MEHLIELELDLVVLVVEVFGGRIEVVVFVVEGFNLIVVTDVENDVVIADEHL